MKTRNYLIAVMVMCSMLFIVFGCGDSTNKSIKEGREIGRYQMYSMKIGEFALPLLLDTMTGKVWKFYKNESNGRMGFEGLTIEGLAYSDGDLKNFNDRISEMEIENLSEKDKKQFRNDILAEFSYLMDTDKINQATINCFLFIFIRTNTYTLFGF